LAESLAGLRALALPALVVTLGLQTLRVFIPSLGWYLRDTLGVGSLTLAAYALGTFIIGFLAAALRRAAGPGLALWITAAGLALARLAEQVIPLPAADLWLSMAGTAFFLLFLPTFVGHVRAQGGTGAASRLAGGLLLGLALDTAIKGAALTLDLSWIPGPAPILVVLVMAAAVIWLLACEPMPEGKAPSEASWAQAAPLLALGPYLLIQALIFQNQGWVAEIAHLSPPGAFSVVFWGNYAAGAGLLLGLAHPQGFRLTAALPAAALVAVVTLFADQPSGLFPVFVLGAQLAMGWGLAAVAITTVEPSRPGVGRTTLLLNLGMLLFLIMAFAYYIALDIALPFPRASVPPAAGVLVALGILGAAALLRGGGREPAADALPLVEAGILLLPLLFLGTVYGSTPQAKSSGGLPVGVMTYNIHSAYTSQGRQDPEAIAEAIEAGGADIVTLQEVSRGWLLDGSTDLVAWLAHRLDMQVLFQGTADPVWGNAILTRFPIVDHGSAPLPLAGTLLPRGYLWARINVGTQQPLLVIATHLHHIEEEHAPRLAQVPVLLAFWDHRPFTLLMGDMNSRPDFPEMKMIAEAGLIDSWTQAGTGEGLTWPATAPYERIDWVWHTPDLKAVEARNPVSTASDHLPVFVLLETASP
jgi:endonuclease/exonuclease/phosphatase family metal-dependent hydrolase